MRSAPRFAVCAALYLLQISVPALAVTTTGLTITDLPTCDVLSAPTTMEEIGLAPVFPVGSQITTSGTVSGATPCPGAVDLPGVGNIALSITNANTVAFSSLYYVGNAGTAFTNIDGTINLMSAFKIDATGVNAPLISGDTGSDGIFSPGETWVFVIQDYTHALLGATQINEIGVPDTGLPPTSSGNILGVVVPEPGTGALLGLGLLALGARRRGH